MKTVFLALGAILCAAAVFIDNSLIALVVSLLGLALVIASSRIKSNSP